MSNSETNLIITDFDYRQYKDGVITGRLRFIVDYIISLFPATIAALVKHEPFQLKGDTSNDIKEVTLQIEFPNLSKDLQKQIESITKEIILKRY